MFLLVEMVANAAKSVKSSRVHLTALNAPAVAVVGKREREREREKAAAACRLPATGEFGTAIPSSERLPQMWQPFDTTFRLWQEHCHFFGNAFEGASLMKWRLRYAAGLVQESQ